MCHLDLDCKFVQCDFNMCNFDIYDVTGVSNEVKIITSNIKNVLKTKPYNTYYNYSGMKGVKNLLTMYKYFKKNNFDTDCLWLSAGYIVTNENLPTVKMCYNEFKLLGENRLARTIFIRIIESGFYDNFFLPIRNKSAYK